MKEIKNNEFWVDIFNRVETAVEDLAVLYDFWKEGEESEENVKIASDHALESLSLIHI